MVNPHSIYRCKEIIGTIVLCSLAECLTVVKDGPWVDYFWDMSHIISSIAILFQLRLWYRRLESDEQHRISRLELVYLIFYEARILYLPHWALQHHTQGKPFQVVAVSYALLHLVILAIWSLKFWLISRKKVQVDTTFDHEKEEQNVFLDKKVVATGVAA